MFKVIFGTLALAAVSGLIIGVAGAALGFVGNYYIAGSVGLLASWLIVTKFTMPTFNALTAAKTSSTKKVS